MKKYLFPQWIPVICLILFPLLLFSGFSRRPVEKSKPLTFEVEADVAHQELHSDFCWFHPRAAAIRGAGEKGNRAVIMTIQKHLVMSDYYSGLYYMRTDDLGETWTDPVEIRSQAWTNEPDGTTVSDGLFLSYTRKGYSNDHIPRNRAPIFLAQVDPDKLEVIRSTEEVLIPEQGAMLGNFGASAIAKDESWVTDAEFMVGDKPNPCGADGSVWFARIKWPKKNKLVKY